MQIVDNKVAFITGGASGIGLGMAMAFAEAGMKIVLADIDEARAKTAAHQMSEAGARALGLHLDVTDRAAWERAARSAEAAFGEIDLLCNNAGVAGIIKPVADIPIEEWRWLTEVMLFGMVHGLQCFVPRMKAKGGGHIVNTSSVGGLSPVPMFGEYVAAKHAVVGISTTLRLEVEADNIGVSVLCPGAVKTSLGESTLRQRPSRAISAGNRTELIKNLNWRYIEPIEAGRIVLGGIRANWSFIFTHPEDLKLIEAQHADITAAFYALSKK